MAALLPVDKVIMSDVAPVHRPGLAEFFATVNGSLGEVKQMIATTSLNQETSAKKLEAWTETMNADCKKEFSDVYATLDKDRVEVASRFCRLEEAFSQLGKNVQEQTAQICDLRSGGSSTRGGSTASSFGSGPSSADATPSQNRRTRPRTVYAQGDGNSSDIVNQKKVWFLGFDSLVLC